jgi:hypothetical protein
MADQNGTTSRILNRLAYAIDNVAGDVTTATTSDKLLGYDDSAGQMKTFDGDNVREVMGVTATAAEINQYCDESAKVVQLTDADYTVLAANSGKLHLIPNVSADRTITLPTPAAGLTFEFWAQLAAADGHDWIIDAGSDTNYFVGGVIHADTDGDAIVAIGGDLDSNSVMQVNLPDAGTWLKFVCDGTLWHHTGIVNSVTVPAYSNQA